MSSPKNEDKRVPNATGGVLEITVQPQFWQQAWFRGTVILCLVLIVVGIVRYVSTQKLLGELQSLRQKEALERERARIARDLHDQLGANLTQVALLGEMAEADKNLPGEIESHARQISENRARDDFFTHWMRLSGRSIPPTTRWRVSSNYACKYAQEYLALAGLQLHRVDPAGAITCDREFHRKSATSVFLAFKEAAAVNNVVKHAQASEVWIRLRLPAEHFILEIVDNCRGLQNPNAPQTPQFDRKLRNMRKRMKAIFTGNFPLREGTTGGTIVRLTVPLAKKPFRSGCCGYARSPFPLWKSNDDKLRATLAPRAQSRRRFSLREPIRCQRRGGCAERFAAGETKRGVDGHQSARNKRRGMRPAVEKTRAGNPDDDAPRFFMRIRENIFDALAAKRVPAVYMPQAHAGQGIARGDPGSAAGLLTDETPYCPQGRAILSTWSAELRRRPRKIFPNAQTARCSIF